MNQQLEDTIAWKKAKILAVDIYAEFRECKDFSFKNQIERAGVSVMNNIAEGFERQTDKEFRNFLYISKGSCGEVRSMLALALELGYIKGIAYKRLCDQAFEISKILAGFIKVLN